MTNTKATIRKAKGGYIVEVRWPHGGQPLGNGEIICKTFDEAVTALFEHVEPDGLKVGEKLTVTKGSGR